MSTAVCSRVLNARDGGALVPCRRPKTQKSFTMSSPNGYTPRMIRALGAPFASFRRLAALVSIWSRHAHSSPGSGREGCADPERRSVAPHDLNPEPPANAVSGELEKPLTNQRASADGDNAIQSVEVNRGAFSGDILPREVGAGSGYADLGVPERVASKLNLQTLLSAGEAKPTARIEAVAVKDRPTSAQQGSRASSRKMGMILAGTSVLPAAAAGLFVLWNLYGTELQEFSSASADRALTWFHEARATNVPSTP